MKESTIEVTIMSSIEIKFVELKNAVKFFTAFKEKHSNAVQLSSNGFRYGKAFYHNIIAIANPHYVNFEHLKSFVSLFTGKEFSRIFLDFENQKISDGVLTLELSTVEPFEIPNTLEFTEIAAEDSETLAKLLIAAGKNKREPETQVLNLKVFDDDFGSELKNCSVDFAVTDGSQIYLKLNNHSTNKFGDVQISADALKKFLSFGNASTTFRLFENQMLLVSGNYFLIVPITDNDFFDYSAIIDDSYSENVGVWSLKALAILQKFIKKIPNKKDAEIKLTNQGTTVFYQVSILDNQVSSGRFPQLDKNAWKSFSVGADALHKLLTVSKNATRLYFDQSQDCLKFSNTQEKELLFILLSELI
jgi:hypothetical protein